MPKPIARPLVGIIGNGYVLEGDYPIQASGVHNISAVNDICDALGLVVPALPETSQIDDLVAHFSGFVFTGARPNVHPMHYNVKESEKYGAFDLDRDNLTLPLIRRCVELALPILCICRGFQELNVAMGGTLHPEIREIPGRDNHRMPPDGTLDEKFAIRHNVTLNDDSPLIAMFGDKILPTNSLHGQGILEAGPNILIDGYAPDGTPEVIRVKDAKGFVIGVQWHPEYNAINDKVSLALFDAFGKAVHRYAKHSFS